MSHPDPRLDQSPPIRLLDAASPALSPEDAATAEVLERVAEPAPDRVAQERVWRAVAAGLPVRPRRGRWLILTATTSLALALIAVGLRGRVNPPVAPLARLALTAGQVLSAEPRQGWAAAAAGALLPEASQLHTEDRGQAVAVLGDSQVLLSAASDLGLESVGRSTFLRLSRGEVVCRVAPRKAGESFVVQTTRYRVTVKGTIFAVRERAEDDVEVSVSRGLVEVTGDEGRWLVPAGSAWHSRAPDAPAPDDIRADQRSLLEQAAGASGPRARISIQAGQAGKDAARDEVEISEGGVRLGPSPVSWDAPVGTYHFVGTATSAQGNAGSAPAAALIEGNVVTTADEATTVTLQATPSQPALAVSAPVEHVATSPARAPLPPSTLPALRTKRAHADARDDVPVHQKKRPVETATPAQAPASTPVPEPEPATKVGVAPTPAATPLPQLARLEPEDAPKPASLVPALAPSTPPLVLAKDPYAVALGLARTGDPLAAAAALQDIVGGRGPHADLALYELGRLRQQKLADPLGALDAYRTYEKDYPRGPLAQEVELSAIEIELQQENLTGALSEIDRFLDAHGKSERAPEVHLLRGDVLRKRGDDAGALREYRRARSQGEGEIAEEGLYRAAACSERLGDTEGAGSALREYLDRYPAGRHAREAAAALGQRKPGP